jgi:DNA-binding CsgD family transcriptional regulator
MIKELTPKEKEMLNVFWKHGGDMMATALEMGVVMGTIKKHRLEVYKKLEVDNAVAMCKKAVDLGLIDFYGSRKVILEEDKAARIKHEDMETMVTEKVLYRIPKGCYLLIHPNGKGVLYTLNHVAVKYVNIKEPIDGQQSNP